METNFSLDEMFKYLPRTDREIEICKLIEDKLCESIGSDKSLEKYIEDLESENEDLRMEVAEGCPCDNEEDTCAIDTAIEEIESELAKIKESSLRIYNRML